VPVYKAPAPVFSWTGCYLGGNIGDGWASKDWANPEGSAPGDRGTAHFNGLVGGGQVGCDYQFAGAWVVGVQGLFDGSGMKGHVLDTANNNFDLTTRINWFSTATARLGYAIQPDMLLYAKGGAAWVRDRQVELNLGAPFALGTFTRSGWIVGGGFERMFAPNWSFFVEYDYMNFGTNRDPLVLVAGGPHHWDIKQNVQTALFGINYRFGDWGKGPVSAKY
jgi:outer membrane immunogenic protein